MKIYKGIDMNWKVWALGMGVALFSGSFKAYALELQPLPQSQVDRVDVDPDAPDEIPCNEILSRLETYNQMARSHDQAVATFLLQTVERIMDWHSILNPFEGETVSLPQGLFAPIQEGADTISEVTNMAYDNAELLSLEMDRIITSLRDCQITDNPEE